MHSNHHPGDRSDDRSRTAWIRRVVVRLLVLTFFWWVLTESDLASWSVGAPMVLIATVVSFWLSARTSWRWRLSGFVRFVPFFAVCSLRGGIDVASRAFNPRLPLAPAMLDYSLRLPEGTARIFFANVVSLLPGTLSANICDDTLVVHVLDNTLPAFVQLERLEAAVAALFGLSVLSRNSIEKIAK